MPVNHPENSPAGKARRAVAEEAAAPVVEEVQSKFDAEQAQGFRGVEVDGTPNENYSVSGVTSGAPTPETDPEQARKATEHLL